MASGRRALRRVMGGLVFGAARGARSGCRAARLEAAMFLLICHRRAAGGQADACV